MAQVSFLLQEVPHYRIEFFNRLHERLRHAEINMQVLYGCDPQRTAGHGGVIRCPWAEAVPTLAKRMAGLDVVWQSTGNRLFDSDLIIVEQSNRLLMNYWLQLRRYWGQSRVAYWGHGKNMQSQHTNGLRERWKRWLLPRVDWWFAYTERTREYLLQNGVDEERTTVVNNSVDGRRFLEALSQYRNVSTLEITRQLGCADDAQLAVFCGQLHRHKHLEFLLQAAIRVRELVPTFELLIVGDGPEREFVQAAARRHPWIHCLGSVLGAERAKYWHAARLAMMPGLVGLVIVDSFIAACPLVTMQHAAHGPEIAYLKSGVNGVITSNDVDQYARAVATLLADEQTLECLRQGCRVSAEQYSLESMVERFASGIEQCLGRPVAEAVV